jgi:NAD(P)-dependent dehydrogenase (short-subunit alcohol dehydrogenase family)
MLPEVHPIRFGREPSVLRRHRWRAGGRRPRRAARAARRLGRRRRDLRDASLHVDDVLPLVQRNLAPAVVGSAEAVRRFLTHGGGAIVNVSSTSPVDGGRAAYGVDPEARDVV